MSRRGFTLIELIIIIIVVGILGSLLYYSWPGYGMNANLAAQQVANDLRYMQYIAHSRSQTYQVTFVPASNRYDLFESDGSSAVKHPFNDSNQVSLPVGVTMSVNSAIRNNILAFDADGEPLQGAGAAPLSSVGQITLVADNVPQYVCIKTNTGLVEVQSSAC